MSVGVQTWAFANRSCRFAGLCAGRETAVSSRRTAQPAVEILRAYRIFNSSGIIWVRRTWLTGCSTLPTEELHGSDVAPGGTRSHPARMLPGCGVVGPRSGERPRRALQPWRGNV